MKKYAQARSFALAALLSAACCPPRVVPAAPAAPATASTETSAAAAESATPPAHEPPFRLGARILPLGYEVELALDPGKDTFSGRVRIRIEVREPTDHIWLHARRLTIGNASMNRGDEPAVALKQLPTTNEEYLGLWFGEEIEPGLAEIEVSFDGKAVDKMFGVFRQELEGSSYIYTQFESTAARTAFPCFDEPGFKVPWQLTLRVPKGMVALSNTPVEKRTDADDGEQIYLFRRTPPLPSYLLAFAVGPFEMVDVGEVGRGKTPVRIVVPRGKAALAEYAQGSVRELQLILEDYFDMAYPYAKLDHIVVPRFFGGMENPGLITYDSSILLVEKGQEGRGFLDRHANVVAHEIAHMWFGNLVTMAWWNDIWLNESFATWLAAKAVIQWKPDWKGVVSGVAARNETMTVDGLGTARKIRKPVEKAEDMSGLFDAISYGKGAAVLWMFERWVGEEAFRAGVRAYIREHAGGNADAGDFLAALAAVAKPEIPAAFATFLDQAGVPVVSLDLACAKGAPPAVDLAQERYLPTGSGGSAAQTWQIPVCLKYGSAGKVHSQCTLLSAQQTRLVLENAKKCPRWVMANAGAAGYYRVAYGPGLIDRLFRAGRKHLDAAERVTLIGDTDALVDAGKMTAGDALSLVPTLLRDRNPHIIDSAVSIVASADAHLVPDELRANFARFVRKTFGREARRLGWKPRGKEAAHDKALRRSLVAFVASAGRDKALIFQAAKLADRWLSERKGLDPDMLGPIMATAAEHGDAVLHQRIYEAAKETKDRRQRYALIMALGSFRAPELISKNLGMFMSGELDMKEASMLFPAMQRPAVHRAAYDYIKKNFDAFTAKMPPFARGYVVSIAGGFCDEAGKKDAEVFFGAKAKDLMNGPKMLANALERAKLCIARRKAQQPSVEKLLRRY